MRWFSRPDTSKTEMGPMHSTAAPNARAKENIYKLWGRNMNLHERNDGCVCNQRKPPCFVVLLSTFISTAVIYLNAPPAYDREDTRGKDG